MTRLAILGLVGILILLALILTGCKETVLGPTKAVAAPAPVTPIAGIPPLAARYARQIIGAWQQQWQVAESPAMAFAQIHQESNFDCTAASPVGAQGCAQFMPGTAQWITTLLPPEIRARCPAKAGCPLDPNWAFAALSTYDRRLWLAFPDAHDWDQRWRWVLASYNGGEGWVRKERAAGKCLRAPVYCKETAGYLIFILDKYRPRYAAWLGNDQRSMK